MAVDFYRCKYLHRSAFHDRCELFGVSIPCTNLLWFHPKDLGARYTLDNLLFTSLYEAAGPLLVAYSQILYTFAILTLPEQTPQLRALKLCGIKND